MKTTTTPTHAAIGHTNNTYNTLTEIQQQLDDLHGRVQIASARPRCTATSISGNHAIHPTNQNCPHPEHHQADMPNGYRIRAYIRKGNEQTIADAMGNEAYYQTLAQALAHYKDELKRLTRKIEITNANLTQLLKSIKHLA